MQFERATRILVERVLGRMRSGNLLLEDWEGRERAFGDGGGPVHRLRVHRPDFFRRLLLRGQTGLGEAYVSGDWDTPDLAGLLGTLSANRQWLIGGEAWLSRLARLPDLLRQILRRNSLRNSPKNIQAHYDLSNEMYALFLDPTMTYSCANFASGADSLRDAQVRKLQTLLDNAAPSPGDHLLEIGCGWGSFARHATETAGCRVTGITLSGEQLRWARERLHPANDAATFQLTDYRQVTGRFDRVVSIEMIEAVGRSYIPSFFHHCADRLKPGGRLAMQAILIPDRDYGEYCRQSDWIQQYIFPGGHCPSGQWLRRCAARRGFELVGERSIGPDYATTLARWDERFSANRADLAALGFDERFFRMWRYYLCLCQAGFATGRIHCQQLTWALRS